MVEHAEPPREPAVAPKLLGRAGLKLRLALASVGVLTAGALLAPRAAPTALAVPDERAAPLLAEQVQQRGIAQAFRGVQDVAARVQVHSVAIPPAAQPESRTEWDFGASAPRAAAPAGYGVAVTPEGDILTHADALRGRNALTVLTAAGAPLEATLVAYEPDTGLALLRTAAPADVSVPPMAAGRLPPGALVFIAAQWAGRSVAAPTFITRAGADVYRVGGDAMSPGAPLYDMDGQLVAVGGGDAPPLVAYPAAEAAARLTSRIATGRGRESSLGLALQPIAENLSGVFGTEGVLISDVVPGSPAARAGLQPGDVLLSVAGTAVTSPESARRAIGVLPGTEPAVLEFLREGRRLTADVEVSTAFDVAWLRRQGAQANLDAPAARVLFSEDELQQAGITADALVLQIDGRRLTSASGQRRDRRRPGPTVAYVEQGGQRFFITLTAAP